MAERNERLAPDFISPCLVQPEFWRVLTNWATRWYSVLKEEWSEFSPMPELAVFHSSRERTPRVPVIAPSIPGQGGSCWRETQPSSTRKVTGLPQPRVGLAGSLADAAPPCGGRGSHYH